MASMKNVGLLYHFAELSIKFSQRLNNYEIFDFLLLSEKGEQNEGLWHKVKEQVPENQIKIVDNYLCFCDVIDEKLNDKTYDKVIVLTQGLLQFSSLIPYKKKYHDKLFLYIRLNAFRHGKFYRPLLSYYYSFKFLKYADYVNFQCAYTTDVFANSKRIFEKNIGGIIPLGLSQEELIRPEHQKLAQVLDDQNVIKIVYLAQFHKHKGHKNLLYSLADTIRQNPKTHLVLLGSGVLFDEVKQLASTLGIGDNVVMPGRVDRKYIPWVLDRSDIAIVLSKIETFGHNILEPLFYGVPVCSTDVGIAREVVKDFYSGFLLKAPKSQLVTSIKTIIENEHLRNHMKKNAKVLSETYTWDAVIDRYIALFERVIMTKG
ncbi:glycosyltransferase family 4 protein [bacterium SCSIO 12844]|nr:glycosyltransferase family 4 protein [bacterium SCSIO 12844]